MIHAYCPSEKRLASIAPACLELDRIAVNDKKY